MKDEELLSVYEIANLDDQGEEDDDVAIISPTTMQQLRPQNHGGIWEHSNETDRLGLKDEEDQRDNEIMGVVDPFGPDLLENNDAVMEEMMEFASKKAESKVTFAPTPDQS